ncbi:MAG: hypothetical protein JSV89_21605 [Spirochaetaceae bacterium]|nr:MAG: hypothetical protein JSV89_21605 [Spirochaetaceae bacterium]
MYHNLEGRQDRVLQTLLERELVLENRVKEDDLLYSGLKDLDAILELILTKFEIANHLLARFDAIHSESVDRSSFAQLIRRESNAAMNMLEELRSLNISEDQKNLVTEAEGYAKIGEQFQAFILRGGGVFLQSKIDNTRKLKTVSRALNESLRKFLAPDDRYAPAFKTEELPGFFRRLINFFLPILAPERQSSPPYGIEEGEEVLLASERMKMPLSQAILLLETEILPQLQKDLEQNPGSPGIQKQISLVRDRLREYRSITFRTRATPINLEKGFYTDWLSQYTAEGELLVTVAIPVRYRSGTNLDRLREMVQTELVRRLAGRGISPALDEDYRFRKSLDSGRRGSSRLPSFKLDIRRGFREIKQLYPALMRLENNRDFSKLIELVQSRGKKRSQKAIENMLQMESGRFPQLP